MRSRSPVGAYVASLAPAFLVLVLLLSGCGSGGSAFGGSRISGGSTIGSLVSESPVPIPGETCTLKVALTFPSAQTKSSTVSKTVVDFAQTSKVVVHVLDLVSHKDVATPVEALRPQGAREMKVYVAPLAPGTYDVFVECFDAQGNSAGYSASQATVVANQTVTVRVTSTVTVAHLAITPATATISSGALQPYTLVADFSDGSSQDVTFVAMWTSGNAGVATIDASGVATGVSGGNTSISATIGVSSAAGQLTVTGAGPTPTPSPTWNLLGTTELAGPQKSETRIAVSADGTRATAVWSAFGATGIESASATIVGNVASWSTVAQIASTGSSPELALSADGTRATVVFKERVTNTVKSASATISGSSATWSPVVSLSAVPGANENIDGPRIKLSADGTRATAMWMFSTDVLNDFWVVQSACATISGNVATWGTPLNVSGTGAKADGAEVALSGAGTQAVAVWFRSNGSKFVVQSATGAVSGSTATWSVPINLSDTSQDATFPSVAISGDGTKATAMFARFNGTTSIVQSTSATISGNAASWSTPVNVSLPGGDAIAPTIAMSSDGTRATAVWLRGPNITRLNVQSASVTISGTTAVWGPITDLSADISDRHRVVVSADATVVMAVYTERYAGTRPALRNKVVTRAATVNGNVATWGAGVDFTPATLPSNGISPSIGLSANGAMATAIWALNDGSNTAPYSASYGLSVP